MNERISEDYLNAEKFDEKFDEKFEDEFDEDEDGQPLSYAQYITAIGPPSVSDQTGNPEEREGRLFIFDALQDLDEDPFSFNMVQLGDEGVILLPQDMDISLSDEDSAYLLGQKSPHRNIFMYSDDYDLMYDAGDGDQGEEDTLELDTSPDGLWVREHVLLFKNPHPLLLVRSQNEEDAIVGEEEQFYGSLEDYLDDEFNYDAIEVEIARRQRDIERLHQGIGDPSLQPHSIPRPADAFQYADDDDSEWAMGDMGNIGDGDTGDHDDDDTDASAGLNAYEDEYKEDAFYNHGGSRQRQPIRPPYEELPPERSPRVILDAEPVKPTTRKLRQTTRAIKTATTTRSRKTTKAARPDSAPESPVVTAKSEPAPVAKPELVSVPPAPIAEPEPVSVPPVSAAEPEPASNPSVLVAEPEPVPEPPVSVAEPEPVSEPPAPVAGPEPISEPPTPATELPTPVAEPEPTSDSSAPATEPEPVSEPPAPVAEPEPASEPSAPATESKLASEPTNRKQKKSVKPPSASPRASNRPPRSPVPDLETTPSTTPTASPNSPRRMRRSTSASPGTRRLPLASAEDPKPAPAPAPPPEPAPSEDTSKRPKIHLPAKPPASAPKNFKTDVCRYRVHLKMDGERIEMASLVGLAQEIAAIIGASHPEEVDLTIVPDKRIVEYFCDSDHSGSFTF